MSKYPQTTTEIIAAACNLRREELAQKRARLTNEIVNKLDADFAGNEYSRQERIVDCDKMRTLRADIDSAECQVEL